MEDCVFCKIVKGEIPTTKVYEDDLVLAMEDIDPIAPVHTLVIPKEHINSFKELNNPELEHALNNAIKEVAKIKNLDDAGFRVITNIGEDGGQAVKHLHFHVLGGRKMMTRESC